MNTLMGFGTAALYALSLAFYISYLYANKPLIGRIATVCLTCGILLNFFNMLERASLVHSVPYQDLFGSMFLFAWLLGLTYLGLEVFHRQRSVGPFVLPFVLVLFLVAEMGPSTPSSPPPARGSLFALHVTLNILAYSAFAISFVLSVIFLIQNHVLRERRPGPTFWRYPSLETLERMSRSSVLVGIIALGIGIIFGFVWVFRVRGQIWEADPKEIASLLIWTIYCVYWWLSQTTGWRGARASYVSVLNFLVVIFSYTIVNIYLSNYHRYF